MAPDWYKQCQPELSHHSIVNQEITMDFGTGLPAGAYLNVAITLSVVLLAASVVSAPWRALVASNERQNVFMASLVLLFLLWLMRFEVVAGAQLHLLGMTSLVLIFGWQLAVVLGAMAGLAMVLSGLWSVDTVALNFLLASGVPAMVTQSLLLLVNSFQRSNLFVYLLGIGFAGGSLSLFASLQVGAWFAGPSFDHAVTLLLIFPEGFLNGTIITALAVFHPRILRTYDESRYLDE